MSQSNNLVIREIHKSEICLLEDYLYEAIFVPEGMPKPPKSITKQKELQVYVEDFGTRPDDTGLVACIGNEVVGACWTRIMNDYGHIADDVPSLAIAVREHFRGQNIGTQLIAEIKNLLRKKGYKKVSLSVQKLNRAVSLYKRTGFETISQTDEEYLMVCDLKKTETC
ncbi:MAG: GNAT family N-acetyltransferase [Bacteroidales bacterium]|nr:GNAT family N-acetyltransferase [Bacteroidales bacterium]